MKYKVIKKFLGGPEVGTVLEYRDMGISTQLRWKEEFRKQFDSFDMAHIDVQKIEDSISSLLNQAEIEAAIECAEHEKHAVAAYKEELAGKIEQRKKTLPKEFTPERLRELTYIPGPVMAAVELNEGLQIAIDLIRNSDTRI